MKKYHFAFQLLAALAILLGTTPSYSFDFSNLDNSVVEHTLENGLKLIIL